MHYREGSDLSRILSDNTVGKNTVQSYNVLLLEMPTNNAGVFTKILLIPPWILFTSIISCMLRQGREFCHASVKVSKSQLHILSKEMNGLQ